MEKQFIGPDEVEFVGKTDKKIRTGDEMLEVHLIGGRKEFMVKKMFEASVTPEATDLTSLRTKRMYQLTQEVLTLLLSWNIKINEVQFLTMLIVESINTNIDKADEKLWGDKAENRTLLDVDNILLKDGGGE